MRKSLLCLSMILLCISTQVVAHVVEEMGDEWVLAPDQTYYAGPNPYYTTYTVPIIPIKQTHFPVQIVTEDCVPSVTDRCCVRHANVYVTGGHISGIYKSNEISVIWLPNTLYAARVNFDLLQDNKYQSTQRCYGNAWVWPFKTVVLKCLV